MTDMVPREYSCMISQDSKLIPHKDIPKTEQMIPVSCAARVPLLSMRGGLWKEVWESI
jgi:hypothetical protein